MKQSNWCSTAIIALSPFLLCFSGCTGPEGQLSKIIEFQVATRDFAFLDEDELGVDVTHTNTGDSVILLRMTRRDSARSRTIMTEYHASYLVDGEEIELRLEDRFTDETRHRVGATFTLDRELEALAPGVSVRKFIVTSNRPITEAGVLKMELRTYAHDTGVALDDINIRTSMFGAVIDPEPYRDTEFEAIQFVGTAKVQRE